ncbi:MAG: nucleotidyltransferase family protein [Candidatus Thiodiazotropha sp. DIVDIV]
MAPLTAVLLAAGSGSRFGSSKLLHPFMDGESIGVASARHLVSAVPRGVAVVRPEDKDLARLLEKLGYRIIENKMDEAGMGDSLALAVRETFDAAGWLIALADMPWIKVETIQTLAGRLGQGASMVAPGYGGKRGHPVGFSDAWGDQLSDLSGDRGARQLLLDYPNELELIPTDDPGVLQDVDYPSDLSVAEQFCTTGNESLR